MDKAQRIFVNTYTQKIQGDDVQCIVDLGMQYQVQTIQLDTLALDNLFMNFYQSQRKDFRTITFSGQLNAQPFDVTLRIDQYIPSLQGFCDFLNDSAYFKLKNAKAVYVQPASYLHIMQFYVCLTTSDATRFIGSISGDGFDKLGYNLPLSNVTVANRYLIGTRHADLSQPPVILVQIDQLPSGISNGFGTMAFMIPNNSSFGSKILYQNTQKHSCQIIKWDTPVPIQQLTIRLLSCDQLPLETPRQNGTSTNNLDMEVNLVFTINNTLDK